MTDAQRKEEQEGEGWEGGKTSSPLSSRVWTSLHLQALCAWEAGCGNVNYVSLFHPCPPLKAYRCVSG